MFDIHPIDNISARLDNIRQHPFQTAISGAAGFFGGPLGGYGANRAFQWWNDRQQNQPIGSIDNLVQQNGNQAAQQGMDRPLSGPLGRDGGNNALASALMGGQSPGMGIGGFNMQQFGQPSSSTALINALLPGQPPPGMNLSGVDRLLDARGGGGGGLGGGSGAFNAWQPPGGGMDNVMNGASTSMMTDFAAPTNGDYMQAIQYDPRIGQAGSAKKR